jgi:hypothetical protein
MAWTDQCKISAVQTIDKVVTDIGLSVKKGIEFVPFKMSYYLQSTPSPISQTLAQPV